MTSAFQGRLFFYDTEFVDRYGGLILLSIGVVGSDGQEFVALNHSVGRPRTYSILDPCDSNWVEEQEIGRRLLNFMKPSVDDPVVLWGYYPAHSHVLLCRALGGHWRLPKGVPLATNCVAQLLGFFAEIEGVDAAIPGRKEFESGEMDVLCRARWIRKIYDHANSMRGEFVCAATGSFRALSVVSDADEKTDQGEGAVMLCRKSQTGI